MIFNKNVKITASMVLAALAGVDAHGWMGSEQWTYSDVFVDNYGNKIEIPVQQNAAGAITSDHPAGHVYENNGQGMRDRCNVGNYWSGAAAASTSLVPGMADEAKDLLNRCNLNNTNWQPDSSNNFFCCPGYQDLPFGTDKTAVDPIDMTGSVCPIRTGSGLDQPPRNARHFGGSQAWVTSSFSLNHGGAYNYRITKTSGPNRYDNTEFDDFMPLQFVSQDNLLDSDDGKYRFLNNFVAANVGGPLDNANAPNFDPEARVQGVDRTGAGFDGAAPGSNLYAHLFDLIELNYPNDHPSKAGQPLEPGTYILAWYWTPMQTAGSYIGCSEITIEAFDCQSNDDCGDDQVCDTTDSPGVCGQCFATDDSNCSTEETCFDNRCVECTNDNETLECDNSYTCINEKCVKDLCIDHECTLPDSICNPDDGVCVGCLQDDQCGDDEVCDLDINQCVDESEENECERDWQWPACGSENPYCRNVGSSNSKQCVQCQTSQDCLDNWSTMEARTECDTSTNTCYDPQGTSEDACGDSCDYDIQHCDERENSNTFGQCIEVECLYETNGADEMCPEGEFCHVGDICVDACEKEGNTCGGDTPFCDACSEDNQCVMCLTDDHCGNDDGDYCSDDNQCVMCLIDEHCSALHECTGDGVCTPQCNVAVFV